MSRTTQPRRHTVRGNAAARRGRPADHRPQALLTPGFAPQLGGSASDLDAWRAMLRDCIVELDAAPLAHAEAAPDRDYAGWVYRRDLGPIGITDVGTDPVRVARTARAIRRSTDAFFLLSIAQRPTWSLHAEHQTSMGAGDAVLLDSAQPFRLAADDFGHHVVVNLPKSHLTRTFRMARDVLGRRIAAGNPMLRVLMAGVAELGKEPGSLPDGSETEIGHTLSELLVATLRWEENARPEDAGAVLGRRAQLLRMQDFVRRHLADPDLSPRLLATAFGVSPRYVEVAFRDGGLSPSRFIRETRLESAARVLADPRQRHRSIAAVARSVGIESPSTFARMFRARYGLSPRDFRHAPFGSAAGDRPGTEGREPPRGS